MCRKSEYLMMVLIDLIFPLIGCLGKNERKQQPSNNIHTASYSDFDQFGYDSNGFDRKGFDRRGFNREGFDCTGYDREGYDSRGFNKEGFDCTGYDREGYDSRGFNREGVDRQGFDRAGLDRNGLNRDGLRAQYPRGRWIRLQQNQQMLWNFEENHWFVAGPEYQEDEMIRAKINQLDLPQNQNPGRFIQIINQNVNQVVERFLDKIAELILNYQDSWSQMDPNLNQIIQLAESVPGSTAIQNGIIWELKRNALARGLVRNAAEFQRLLGAIPASLTQSLYFLEARTQWFIDSLPIILGQEGLSYRDVNDLRDVTQNMRFYPALNNQRDGLIALIDRTLQRKRAEFPIRELEVLNARVRALYNRVRPLINPQSKFKFYLIRDQAAWANDRVAHVHVHHGEPCLICAEDLNHEHPGVTCPMHPHIAYHATEDCLIPHVQNQIMEQRFPITCGDLDNPHELPITEELLRNGGLLEPEIRAWKIHTLRSYYEELIRLQNGRVAQANPNPARAQVICTTPDCGSIIFPENVRAETRTHVCEVCTVERCHQCGELPHPWRVCGQAEAGMIPPPESRYRPCPYCLTITDRVDGCNSIRCGNRECGKIWNFNKGKPRATSLTHDFEPDVNHPRPREYRVPGDPDYVAGQNMECAYPAHQGNIIE